MLYKTSLISSLYSFFEQVLADDFLSMLCQAVQIDAAHSSLTLSLRYQNKSASEK